ncbi:class I SAM-dependent methyltransferase [Dactylosporangium sp. NBC_01737]|uniref:class I SAM-dependent methyltransferase n=1 Tax=Dactylosporangium sp. NBC_01737 TaxID=2975959 RepID=UPI002E0FDAC8|nr:class I SAM-dependent methyltransferase [Dactylosporangium sp. NBC_01737]
MTKNWAQWHEDYDNPNSWLAQRLEIVQRDLRRALVHAPCDPDGTRRLISICAGEGRDVLPVLADDDHGYAVRALLVELDQNLSQRARTTAATLGLSNVEVATADAGEVEVYRSVTPAHVIMACGVFGNISSDDIQRTIATLPVLLTVGGIVIWTRGLLDNGYDPSLEVRRCLEKHGFAELSFSSPAGSRNRVGMHQLSAHPAYAAPVHSCTRIFDFL